MRRCLSSSTRKSWRLSRLSRERCNLQSPLRAAGCFHACCHRNARHGARSPIQYLAGVPRIFRSDVAGGHDTLRYSNQSAEAIKVQRATEKVTLAFIAQHGLQHRQVLLGFDTFGSHSE